MDTDIVGYPLVMTNTSRICGKPNKKIGHVVSPIINLPFGNGLYNPFMTLEMADYW